MLGRSLRLLSILCTFALSAAGVCAGAANATALVVPVIQPGKGAPTQLFEVESESLAFNSVATPSANFSSFESPSWSADGEQLTYVSVGKQVNSSGGSNVQRLREIWVQSADGVERRRVTRDAFDYLPVFSEDSKRIAFARQFPARSGAGCMRGGLAVATVNTRTLSVTRISRCFKNLLLRSSLQFIDNGRRVAFVGDRRHVSAVRVSGADAAIARPATIYKQPKNETVVSIRAAIPKAKKLWIDFEDGSSVLAADRGKAVALPDASFAVAPTGKVVIVNCGALPSDGNCVMDVKSHLRNKLKTPFSADFTQDSAEFGFSFSSDGQSLASFGFGSHDALNGLSDLQLCVRVVISAAPKCGSVKHGSVAERDSDVALWQPRPSGA